jgi:hypothetical protein
MSCLSIMEGWTENRLFSSLEGLIISGLFNLEWQADRQLTFHLKEMTISCFLMWKGTQKQLAI